ncbi:MAG: TonB-dependent receptor [Steroidobacteraceae bacterium]|nr:TonB-dependent receptor [Steroidobacteraceae bacterium]
MSLTVDRRAVATRVVPAARGTLLAMAALSSAPGLAQQSSAPRAPDAGAPEVLQEVIVTARGREEDVQDVPIAITVLSGEALQARTVLDVRDLVAFTPSLTFYSGSGRADLTALVVRGLSPQTSDERYQGLSVFVDGIYVSGQLAGIDLSQMQRVEILKGPQSAKYGRATYSGAIDYITKTPEVDEIQGGLRVRYGDQSGEDSASNVFATGDVAFPILKDRLWASLNATRIRVGGLYPNRGRDGGRIGAESTNSYGTTLFARFSEDTTLKLRYAVDFEEDGPPLATVVQPTDWGGRPYNIGGLYTITSVNPITAGCPAACAGIGTVWIDGDIPNTGAGLVGTDVTSVFPVGFLPAEYADFGGRNRKRQFASALFASRVAGLDLSYRFGWFEQEYWAVEDFRRRAIANDPVWGPLGVTGASKAGGLIPAFEELFRNQSHQLQLASSGEQRLRWSAGLYYFEEDNRNKAVVAPTSLVNPGPTVVRQSRGLERFRNEAVFGDLAYDVTDRLTLSVEGRYQRETVYLDACTTCTVPNPADRAAEESDFLPRITAQYAFTDEVNGYLYWSKGVKSGRLNTSAAAFNFAFVPPEELENLELGLKSTLLDGALILNVSLFQQDITGQQLLVQVPNPACTFNPVTGAISNCPPGTTPTLAGVQSVGGSEIYGAELEGRWQATERFSLTYGVGYARHEFVDAVGPFRNTDPQLFLPGETLEGKTSINSPRVTGNLSGEYRMPVAGGAMDLAFRLDALHTGRRYIDLANRASIEAVTRFNARATLSSDDGRWSASLFGRDLTDEETLLGAGLTGSSTCYFPETPLPAATRATQLCQFVGIPRGREIGIELGYRF